MKYWKILSWNNDKGKQAKLKMSNVKEASIACEKMRNLLKYIYHCPSSEVEKLPEDA